MPVNGGHSYTCECLLVRSLWTVYTVLSAFCGLGLSTGKAQSGHLSERAIMTPPLLHVIYAGRGDAMFLQYNVDAHERQEKNFIILDDGGDASYHKFPASALRMLRGEKPNLTAMIASHADLDRYERSPSSS